MRTKWILFFLIGNSTCLLAQHTPSQKMLQNYYLNAIVIPPTSIQNYTQLNDSSLSPWERALISLNIAGLELAEGHWQQSALLLEPLPLTHSAPADYMRALWQNRALTHWLEAIEQKKSSAKADQEDALELLELSQAELQLARIADEPLKKLKQQIAQQSQLLSNFQEKIQLTGMKEILKKLINFQQKNLKTVLWQQNGSRPENSLTETQKEILALASEFVPGLIKEQEQLYRKEGLCQCHPWDRLIPLFEEGVSEAQIALRFTQDTPPALGAAVVSMRRALIAWKNAFLLFDAQQNPVPQESPLSDPSSVKEIWRSLQKTSRSEAPFEPVELPPQNFGERQW